MVDMNIADYPKMNKSGRKKYHRAMKKEAYPRELQKEMSFEEFAEKLNGRR